MYDILIIGAGITGSLIARKLSLYSLKVAVVEKGNDVAEGASMANSAILHTGYDPEEGTLKAKLNVEGAKLFPQLLKDLDCTYKQVGAYVVSSEENKEKLDVLASRAAERGIPHSWLSGEDLHRSEPHLASKIQYALCFPTTCIVYPWEIVTAAMEVAIQNGTRLFLNHEVIGIQKTEKGYRVETTRGSFETEMILNCSGTHTEQLARMVSERVSYHVHPRKGEYFVLDKGTDFVHHILFNFDLFKSNL